MLTEKSKLVLSKARLTYGNKNQISVAIEELNELACVLCKFIRYEHEEDAVEALYDKVVDELEVFEDIEDAEPLAVFGDVEPLEAF